MNRYFNAVAMGLCTLAVTSTLSRAQWDAPVNYYSGATGTGSTLLTQLRTIVTTGAISRSYDDARFYLAITDRDPTNTSRLIQIYNRVSVPSTWDSGNTWNREHQWPQSQLGGSTTGPGADAHNLRPCNPVINSTRGNTPFGSIFVTSLPATYGEVTANNGTGTFWNPGAVDRGDTARSMFYMATRWSQLSLVNGQPGNNQMGDLQTLLRWHYQDTPDEFERRRNHVIFSQSQNPTYYQNNRNPYIDRPEFVWAVFGGSANDSRILVNTANVPFTGATTATVDLGRSIVGTAPAAQNFTITKTGTAPTTYNATVIGPISSSISGVGRTFDFNSQTASTTIAYTGSVASPANITGSITLDNTDLTFSNVGHGAMDGNDTINVTGAILSPSNASFSASSSLKSTSYDFGIVARDANTPMQWINIHNLPAAAGASLTASMNLDGLSVAGNGSAFFTPFEGSNFNHTAGTFYAFGVDLNTTAVGTFAATYTIINSDENIPGAQTRANLVLSVAGRVAIGGDANLDGSVNFADLLILAQNYNQAAGSSWQTGDFDRDGQTVFSDLLVLAQNYGSPATLQADWSRAQLMVPEPATLVAIFASGALLARRRR
jgi:endonuclease I